MDDPALSDDLENSIRRSVAEGRIEISKAAQLRNLEGRATFILRLWAVMALGLVVAGLTIFAVFIVLNLVFHFSPG